MKKYFFYLSMALVAFVVASCGLKGNHTSSGRPYELLVVVDAECGTVPPEGPCMMCLILTCRDCPSRNLLSGLCILHRRTMILR